MTFKPLLQAISIALISVIPALASAQAAAYLELTNATNATLVVEIVRQSNRAEFVVAEVASGATETGSVPSGYVTMTITAPHSDTGARFTQNFALNTDEGYELVVTPQMLGFASLRDDDLIQPVRNAAHPSRFYETCAGINSGSRVMMQYNPNGMTRSYYLEAGPLWCHDGGEAVYIQNGDDFEYWACTAGYQNCAREEGWDGFLGAREDSGMLNYEGRERYTELFPFNWSVGDYSPHRLRIFH